MNTYLIGYRCSGKTTIGRVLSRRLKTSFFDTDEEVMKHFNMTISTIVLKYGWSDFRVKEKEMLFELTFKNNCVVATGGGIVLDYDNINLMKRSGILVWLRARIETVKNWILTDYKTEDTRPSITGNEIMKDIEKTFDSRAKIYSRVSDFSVSTDNFNLDHICNRILCFIKEK